MNLIPQSTDMTSTASRAGSATSAASSESPPNTGNVGSAQIGEPGIVAAGDVGAQPGIVVGSDGSRAGDNKTRVGVPGVTTVGVVGLGGLDATTVGVVDLAGLAHGCSARVAERERERARGGDARRSHNGSGVGGTYCESYSGLPRSMRMRKSSA